MNAAEVSAWRDAAINRVIRIEGGKRFTDDPDDPGGKTRFGITERLARHHGYAGSMRRLPRDVAVRIYRAEFWDPLRLDDVLRANLPRTADEMLESSVNCGAWRTGEWLQSVLRAMGAELLVDGAVGPRTVAALREVVRRRRRSRSSAGEIDDVLYAALNSMQGWWYLSIPTRRPASRKFIWGWLRARVAPARSA